MKKNRLICLMIIIATLKLIDSFGGSFSYALFYASLCIPLASWIYMLYVYFKLKIYQTIETKIMTKGDRTNYTYIIANEDFLFFKSIGLSFISDYSKVDTSYLKGRLNTDKRSEQINDIHLFPSEKIEQTTGITCLYRGEYEVGIESILIKDFLGLFSVTMQRPSTITARVYPRILHLSSLAALDFNVDNKTSPFAFSSRNEMPDIDLRSYTNGDSLKTVNWKVSAKYNDLFVRRYVEIPKERILILPDVSPVLGNSNDSIILEDILLETTLAIADYYRREQIESEISYYKDSVYHYKIKSNADFNAFYEACVALHFNSKTTVGEYIQINQTMLNSFHIMIVITTSMNAALLQALSCRPDIQAYIILIGAKSNDDIQSLRILLGKTKLIHIAKDGDVYRTLTTAN